MVLFLDVKGGKEVVFKFLNVLMIFVIFNNFGDFKFIVMYLVIIMY